MKHITQLTEFVTGMGARIGYPNEHLAGGYTESLMNPMYSTCIGLILRGYHDFESGKMRFAKEGGNMIHITEDELKPFAKEAIPEAPKEVSQEPVAEKTEEEVEEMSEQRTKKRNENVKKLFDGLKGKFMKLFEDVEDQEIH